jgi:hypothetical protein
MKLMAAILSLITWFVFSRKVLPSWTSSERFLSFAITAAVSIAPLFVSRLGAVPSCALVIGFWTYLSLSVLPQPDVPTAEHMPLYHMSIAVCRWQYPKEYISRIAAPIEKCDCEACLEPYRRKLYTHCFRVFQIVASVVAATIAFLSAFVGRYAYGIMMRRVINRRRADPP